MVRGNGGGEVVVGARPFPDEVHGFLRRDVFEGDAEFGKSFDERLKACIDKHAFAVENIGRLVCDLAVDGEGEVVLLHLLEQGEELR